MEARSSFFREAEESPMTEEKKHDHEHGHASRRRRLHRDWRVWVIVGLMLAAMFAYVLSDDEALQFGGGASRQPVPAAVGP
jgi:hypothetical protein